MQRTNIFNNKIVNQRNENNNELVDFNVIYTRKQ